MAGRRETTSSGASEATTKPGVGRTTSRRLKATGVSVDAYLAALPPEQLALLQEVRKAIHQAAPGVTETVRYKVPTFVLGVPLVGFSASKQYCSFFVMSHAVMQTFRRELAPFHAGPGILRFGPNAPLPLLLVKRIVVARVKETQAAT